MTSTRDRQASALCRIAGILSAVAVCLATSGCGNGLANVSGQVTLDGQPLRGGTSDVRVTVQFQPASGAGTTAIGLADENGNYTLGTGSKTGIPPGDYLVTCTGSELIRSKKDPDATPGGRLITDPKYANPKTSGLKFTVQSGRNEFNIPLQGVRKVAPRTGG